MKNDYHSWRPLTDYLVGGLIALMTITCPVIVIVSPHLANSENNVKINNIVNRTLQ